jgi:hypothetical protein
MSRPTKGSDLHFATAQQQQELFKDIEQKMARNYYNLKKLVDDKRAAPESQRREPEQNWQGIDLTASNPATKKNYTLGNVVPERPTRQLSLGSARAVGDLEGLHFMSRICASRRLLRSSVHEGR